MLGWQRTKQLNDITMQLKIGEVVKYGGPKSPIPEYVGNTGTVKEIGVGVLGDGTRLLWKTGYMTGEVSVVYTANLQPTKPEYIRRYINAMKILLLILLPLTGFSQSVTKYQMVLTPSVENEVLIMKSGEIEEISTFVYFGKGQLEISNTTVNETIYLDRSLNNRMFL